MSWLLTYVIPSTILLGCAAIVTWRFSDHHAWLDRIWKIAMIAPLVTATVNFDVAVTPLGSRWTMPYVEIPTSTVSDIASMSTSNVPTPRAVADGEATKPDAAQVLPTRTTVAAPEKQGTEWNAVVSSVPIVVVVTWLAPASLLVVRYLIRLRQAYRALRAGTPVTSSQVLDSIAQLLREGIARRPVRVSTNDLCRVPLALGGQHIVLPPQFFDELDPEQQRAALAHELAHIIRRDPQWRQPNGKE